MVTRRVPLMFAIKTGRKTSYTTYSQVRDDPTLRKQVLNRIFAELQKWRGRHGDTLHFLKCAERIEVVDAIDDALKKRNVRDIEAVRLAQSTPIKAGRIYAVVHAEHGKSQKSSTSRRVKKTGAR